MVGWGGDGSRRVSCHLWVASARATHTSQVVVVIRFDFKSYKRARAIGVGLQWLHGMHALQIARDIRARAQKRSQLG